MGSSNAGHESIGSYEKKIPRVGQATRVRMISYGSEKEHETSDKFVDKEARGKVATARVW